MTADVYVWDCRKRILQIKKSKTMNMVDRGGLWDVNNDTHALFR